MEFIFLSLAARRPTVAVDQNSADVFDIVDVVFMGKCNGSACRLAAPHRFHFCELLGKRPLHRPEKCLVFSDSCIVPQPLGRRYGFTFPHRRRRFCSRFDSCFCYDRHVRYCWCCRLCQLLPLPTAANPFFGLLSASFVTLKILQLIPDDNANHAAFIAFDKAGLFQRIQPLFNKRTAAVQTFGNELRRHGFLC